MRLAVAAAVVALAAAAAAACPPPATPVPPDVPLPGCPEVSPAVCTTHCMPSMTHLVLAYPTAPVAVVALGQLTAALAVRGWRVTGHTTARLAVLEARRGHDRLTASLPFDNPSRIWLTFAPG